MDNCILDTCSWQSPRLVENEQRRFLSDPSFRWFWRIQEQTLVNIQSTVYWSPPVNQRCFRWHRLGSDDDGLCGRHSGKLGSFADDWYFLFAPEEDQIEVSQPGVGKENELTNEFMKIQKIVLRKLKLYASNHYLFGSLVWKEFKCIIETESRSRRGVCSCSGRSYGKITDDTANNAKQNGGYTPLPLYGKLSYLKFEKRFYWEREYFRLDD